MDQLMGSFFLFLGTGHSPQDEMSAPCLSCLAALGAVQLVSVCKFGLTTG